MKRNAAGTLIKDIILAVAAWAIFAFLFDSLWASTLGEGGAQSLALFFAGVPFGWRWASNIITAISPKGIAIKFAISLFLGWFAIVIILIGDIIRCIAAKPESKKRAGSAQEFE